MLARPFYFDGGWLERVSSTSLRTACNDRVSGDMFFKLSGSSLQDLRTYKASCPTAMESAMLYPKLNLILD